MHIERHKSSKTISWRYFETIRVCDGQGKLVETMRVCKIEEGKFHNYVTFEVTKH